MKNETFYQNIDTGVLYTLNELKEIYNADYENRRKNGFGSFDDFLNYNLQLSRDRRGGLAEFASVEEFAQIPHRVKREFIDKWYGRECDPAYIEKCQEDGLQAADIAAAVREWGIDILSQLEEI